MGDTVDTEATVGMEDMEVMEDTVWVTAGDTTASVRLRPRLSPTMATEDMEATVGMEDMEDMVDTVWVTAGDITASVRLRLRPSTTMATEGSVEDTEDTEATGATVATMVDTMASVRPRPSPSMAMEVR